MSEQETQEHRGGNIVVIQLTLGIAAVVVSGFAAYFAYSAVGAQNVANALELAKWKYDNDRMNLTEAEKKLLGLDTGTVTVTTNNTSTEVNWVSYGDPGAYPPAGMFISQYDWDRYRQSRGYELGGGGGGLQY